MIEALRPSTLGEILDRTANLYRARFLVFCLPFLCLDGFGRRESR
jgi:hypothetical protein